ncbi:MAG: hypothetical protein ABIF22_01430 [bacterium]
METKYQTSFIPKKPVNMAGSSRSGGMSLFLLVSLIIFLISLGLAGYVFLEKNLLIKNITTDQNTIEANKSGLVSDSITIESLVELNSRTNVAKDLLSKHIAVSPIFDFLQQGTLKSVRFKNFSFSSAGKNESGQNKVSIQMSGVARDWETVASQADEFGKPDWKNIINEPKISNLSLEADGSVSFLFAAYVVPDFLVYGTNTSN